jgi:hypothetical protein
MPLIQWIMQNLQPLNKMSGGVEANGEALIERLSNLVSSGGVIINGDSESIVISFKNGVEIGGNSDLQAIFNIDSTGSVVINGSALSEVAKNLGVFVNYLPGDTVYLATGQPYIVQGFYYDITKVILYELFNGSNVLFVEESELKSLLNRDREGWLLYQLEEADKMIAMLSA